MNEPAYRPPGTRYLRTDVRYMRRRELFRSAGEFLIAGLLGLATTFTGALAWLPGPAKVPNFFVAAVLFGLVVASGMGLVGAFYLLVRACLRDNAYDPERVWLADTAHWAALDDSQDPAMRATVDRIEIGALRTEPLNEFVRKLLLGVAQSQFTAEEAMRELLGRESELASKQDKLLDQAWHLISHYRADADIRAREPSYGVAKRRDMEQLAVRLMEPRGGQ